jgi:hypothetical protein
MRCLRCGDDTSCSAKNNLRASCRTSQKERSRRTQPLIGVAMLIATIGTWATACSPDDKPSLTPGRAVIPSPHPSSIKWSGSGPDCSPEGHYDQTIRGAIVSSAYTDECDGATPTLPAKTAPPCTEFKDPTTGEIIKNGPVGNCAVVPPPPPAELAKLHKEWMASRPSSAFLARQAKTARLWQAFDEAAKTTRWIDAPVPLGKAKLDEFYELPGEDGNSACAEVIYAPPSYDAYAIIIFVPNGERELKAATQHLAEEMAVLICGKGHPP